MYLESTKEGDIYLLLLLFGYFVYYFHFKCVQLMELRIPHNKLLDLPFFFENVYFNRFVFLL